MKYTTKGRPDNSNGNPGRSTRNARFRATSHTNFDRFDQTGGSNAFQIAPKESQEYMPVRDSSAPPAMRS